MKNIIFRIIKFVIVISVVVAVVFVGQNAFFYNDDKLRIDGFYLEDKNSLDVVLIGASDVFSDFSSSLAYKDYGYTSYPFSTNAASLSMLKYEVEEVLKHQSPQLIIIEVNSALYDEEYYQSMDEDVNERRFLDSIPLSVNKINALKEKKPDEYLSYVFPFVKYHEDWVHINGVVNKAKNYFLMQNRGYSLLKGNQTFTDIQKFDFVYDLKNDDSRSPLYGKLEREFVDFLNYCKEKKLTNVVFARFPHAINEEVLYDRFQRANTLCDLTESYGFDFLNFEKEFDYIGLDPKKDFFNSDHMNIYGQKKFTKYLSEYLIDEYSLSPKVLNPEQKKRWDESAEYYDLFFQCADEKIKSKEKVFLSETADTMSELNKYLK